MRLKLSTAGETHGPGLTAVLEGLPRGLRVDARKLDALVDRWRAGYYPVPGGEAPRVEITGGLRYGRTLGSPLALRIPNPAHEDRKGRMDTGPVPVSKRRGRPVTVPRPGQPELAAYLRDGGEDLRELHESGGGAQLLARTAAGGVALQLLSELRVEIFSHLLSVGGVKAHPDYSDLDALREEALSSDLALADSSAAPRMLKTLKGVASEGDSLGGVAEIIVRGLPAGIGDHAREERRLDGRLGRALLSLPEVQGLEIGPAFENAAMRGSRVTDGIVPDKKRLDPLLGRYARTGNRAGGLEEGQSTGQPLMLRLAVRPPADLARARDSVDTASGGRARAPREEEAVASAAALGVAGEAVTALVLAGALIEQFGAGTLKDIKAAWRSHLRRIARL